MTKDVSGPTPPIPATPIPDGYAVREEVVIPSGHGRSVRVAAGELIQLIDVRGQQVSDIMAWRLADPDEYMSPGHTISCLTHLVPKEGEEIFSNHRRPLFRIRRDTVGSHDLIVPCCDPERYSRDYGLTDHRSCLGNIREGLDLAGETWPPRAELAWNVFMNNVLQPDGSIRTFEPPHPAGSYIELEALDDLGVVASSCPQDLTACNAFAISEMAFRVLRPVG
jgi:uncharacterized protein YcgI (DUF1989 family)